MKVALVGNQNCGKSTLFNALTGMNAKIGNWPGVTIEKKSGFIRGTSHELIDLPGIYSLSPYSLEEDVSRKFIFYQNPNVIINVVDSTCLERSLYLTTQLMELDCKVIVALNMTDIIEKKGKFIDITKLKNMLGTSVIKISALKGIGINELVSEINLCEKSDFIDYKEGKINCILCDGKNSCCKIYNNIGNYDNDYVLNKKICGGNDILNKKMYGNNLFNNKVYDKNNILNKKIYDNHNIINNKIYDNNLELAIEKIIQKLPKDTLHKRFVAVKIIEGDNDFIDLMNNEIKNIKYELINNSENIKNNISNEIIMNNISSDTIKKNINNETVKYSINNVMIKNNLSDDHIKETVINENIENLEELIATQRYNYIEKIKEQCYSNNNTQFNISDKIDKIILNKWLAFPIFFIIMFFIYYISIDLVGKYTSDIMENFIQNISSGTGKILQNLRVPIILKSLIVDGIISGVGAVLGFIPQLIFLFTSISILETTGYMSRIALIFDKIFRKIGLNGKSIIPFIVGSGCSVSGIMGTRIIENERERIVTASLTSFIPCSAKLPIIALFSGYFYGERSGLIAVSLYFMAIIIIVVSGLIIKKFNLGKMNDIYVSELPEYKLPSLKYVTKEVLEKTVNFVKKAGSVILISSIIIWFLLSFSLKLEYGVCIEDSILAIIGKSISWLFYPMLGVNSWEVAVSSIQGLVAKEQVISSMSIISGFSDIANDGNVFFVNGSFGFFTPISAYAFMIFNLFSAPCISAISALCKELGGIKKVIKVIGGQTILAWIIATAFYQVGTIVTNLGL